MVKETEKGREYNNFGKLIFVGEYLKRKKNGKGEEYYKGKRLKFKGEYINGKKWNGKGYNIYNNIIYELKEGKGFIKEYNYWFNLEFEGEYLNDERNIKGKEYIHLRYKTILYFEGEYLK